MTKSITAAPLSGVAIIQAFKDAGIEVVVSVPDRVTSDSVLRRLGEDPVLKLVRICKEDEGVSICAALAVCGKRSVLLMQCTGLLDSVNSLRAIAYEYQQPVVMMVGLLTHESDTPPAESPNYGVSVVPRVLDAMKIEYDVLHSAGDEKRIVPAIERAYATSTPFAILIGRSPK